jgi:hypothetical protein
MNCSKLCLQAVYKKSTQLVNHQCPLTHDKFLATGDLLKQLGINIPNVGGNPSGFNFNLPGDMFSNGPFGQQREEAKSGGNDGILDIPTIEDILGSDAPITTGSM